MPPPPAETALAIGLPDIVAARARLEGSIVQTTCGRSETLSNLTGRDVFLKLENLQMTGSFKERGALNRIAQLTLAERTRGVVAASAGNHAQGVAYHATKRGIPSLIVMPQQTPLVKVTATRNFGAEVILFGANYDEACSEAMRLRDERGLIFIHPFDDPAVIAGQGTIGLELLDQVPALDAVLIPIGGGGLIGGIACALKELRPPGQRPIKVIGVQTARLPSMQAAVTAGEPVTVDAASTVADGIAVRRAGDLTFPLVRRYVDAIVTVFEDEIASAILLLLEREKTLAEGAGAAALAALLQTRSDLPDAKEAGNSSKADPSSGSSFFHSELREEPASATGPHHSPSSQQPTLAALIPPGSRVAVLICGGNIDVTLLSRIIERGLVEDGRLIRLRIHLLDRPGALVDLTRVIAEHRVNIVDTLYNRAYYGVNLGDTTIDITMETRGRHQLTELLHALTTAGYKHSRVL